MRSLAPGRFGQLWDDPDFRRARAIIYVATLALMALMLFADPFEYICNQPGYACPGCGFKTGLALLPRLDVADAVRLNPLCLAVPILVVAAILDVACWAFKRERHRGVDDVGRTR